MVLTKEQILNAADMRVEVLEVPEWGGAVNVRTLSGLERDAWELSLINNVDQGRTRANLVARCLVDDEGQRLFTDNEVLALGQKSATALRRCFDVAQRMNGIGMDAEETAQGN